MDDGLRLFLDGEESVESRHAIRLCGRNTEPGTEVVERAWSDPSKATLHRMESGQQQMALTLGHASLGLTIGAFIQFSAPHPGIGRSQHLVHGRTFLGRGEVLRKMQIQRVYPVPTTTRCAECSAAITLSRRPPARVRR